MASWRESLKKRPKSDLRRLENSHIQDNFPAYGIFTAEKIFSSAVIKSDKARIKIRTMNTLPKKNPSAMRRRVFRLTEKNFFDKVYSEAIKICVKIFWRHSRRA